MNHYVDLGSNRRACPVMLGLRWNRSLLQRDPATLQETEVP